ncbi:MAG: chaperone modulator CbpM [Gammaproteobacteria bacterium]|jgi:chaperone modulatory protein CbpM|nr:chaperone modulator CbpM [Gammaproteobacteria bacterium]
MKHQLLPLLSGEVLEEHENLTLEEFCRVCRVSVDEVYILVEEGIVEPSGHEARVWRFHGANVRRVRCAVQLRRDLGVNWAGAALALDLLEELQELRTRLRRFEGES